MDRVESIVTHIQGLSSTHDDWPALLQQLESSSTDLPPAAIDAILSHLSPPIHTVGCIFYL
jgi:hypothetical protein